LRDILTQVKNDITQWTNNNGVIDAWALENIRKNALSSYIISVPAGAEAAEKVAKQAAGKVKDIVADAIEEAGGTGYRNYLAAYSKGAQRIAQTEMGAQALRLYESAPRTFIKVIEGNDPKLIEKIFGPGSYNVAKEMSDEAMGRLKGIAAEVKRDREVATQAKAGQERLAALMKEYGVDLSLPNVFNIVATTGNKVLSGLSKRINKATLDTLIEASKTAKSFDELLATVPASERSKILQYLNDPSQFTTVRRITPAAGGIAAGLMSQPPEYTNMLAPEPAQNMLMVR
jgi:type IV secretory pathway VirJ component